MVLSYPEWQTTCLVLFHLRKSFYPIRRAHIWLRVACIYLKSEFVLIVQAYFLSFDFIVFLGSIPICIWPQAIFFKEDISALLGL